MTELVDVQGLGSCLLIGEGSSPSSGINFLIKVNINDNRKMVQCKVSNNGDRPVQVGSHYHFFEVNDALNFNRKLSRGYRLNIPAGTAIRFEPGQTKQVELVANRNDEINNYISDKNLLLEGGIPE